MRVRKGSARGLICAISLAGCGEAEEPVTPCALPLPKADPVMFTDATAALGIDVTHHFATDFCELTDTTGGPGVCVLDYDGDQDLDIYFVDRAPHSNHLYRNDGERFTDVTEATGAGDTGDSMGCLAFDADGDADIDLYVSNVGPDRLLRNDEGVFTDATEELGIQEDGFSSSATAGDIDGDGDLDLVVGQLVDEESCPEMCFLLPLACPARRTLVFENRGAEFVETGMERGITAEEPTLATLLFDIDGDGDLDLYLGNDMGVLYSDRLYVNDGTGHFVDQADAFGLAAAGTDTMGVDVGDYDGDGVPDLITTDFKHKPTRLFHCFPAPLPCSFESLGAESLPSVDWGVGFVDFNHDGRLDVFTAGGDVYDPDRIGDRNQVYFNREGRFFEHLPAAGEALDDRQISRGAAFGDLDGDGDVDVVVANAGGTAQVLYNQSAAGHSLTVALDTRSAGARVTVTAGGRALTEQALIGGSYLGSSDPRIHFGLGEACTADVSVRWLDGSTRDFTEVTANQVLRVDR
jgi:enediyne biosynthesis protein E4